MVAGWPNKRNLENLKWLTSKTWMRSLSVHCNVSSSGMMYSYTSSQTSKTCDTLCSWGTMAQVSIYIEKRSISTINNNNNYNINDRLINWLFVHRQNPPPRGSSGHIVTDGEYKGVILHGFRWDPKSFSQYTFASTYICM